MLFGFVLRSALIASTFVLAANATEPCANLAYENHNQIDYGPFALRRLAG